MHHRLGDWDLAEAHLAVVTELVEDAEPGRLARVQADRAVVAYRRGDAGQAAEFGQAALRSAQAAGDPEATAQALNVLGMLAARAGRHRRGRGLPARKPGRGQERRRTRARPSRR